MNNSTDTILLVEDNEDDVFVMRRALQKAQITNPLQVANDGQEAIDYLAGNGQFVDRALFPLPAITFLDLKLPYFTGFEVLEWIRQQPALPPLNIIILSSSNEQRDVARARELGAQSYLVKPPTPDRLKEILR